MVMAQVVGAATFHKVLCKVDLELECLLLRFDAG